MAWQEGRPKGTDIPNAELASLITSQKQTFDSYIGKHFYWTESSGLSAGIPRLSDGSAGPGSARVFYGTASQVSAVPNMSGKLMVTSDTSRFYALQSTQSNLLGGVSAIAYSGAGASAATVTQNTMYRVQSSLTTVNIGSAGTVLKITYPTAYNAVPLVELTPIGSNATWAVTSALSGAITASSFSVFLHHNCGGGTGICGFYWRSIGTVNL
jgi:hypothetical protein